MKILQQGKIFVRRVRRSFVWRTIRLMQKQAEWWHVPPVVPPMPEEVQRALQLASSALKPLMPTQLLAEEVHWQSPTSITSNQELFSFEGKLLPCWQDSDMQLYDNWLTDPTNYGYYFELFKAYAQRFQHIQFLEIGVRTGYIGVVFAKALRHRGTYYGIDPNGYVKNGLSLAANTFRLLREALPDFQYTLFEGYSWDQNIQHSVGYTAPYQLIHIDGDHSLAGKLLDLYLARQWIDASGWILVDDYDHHPPVKDALQRAFLLGWFREFAYVPTKRGLAVIR